MASRSFSVFQCCNCNSIVCDSQCNILINQELGIISADKATNVTVINKTKLVSDGIAEGSTYLDLECNCCKTIIGKSFKSTTSVTDLYRDTFSFDFDKIKSYVIGSCTMSRKEGINSSNNSNAILLSFDSERASKDAEVLEQLTSLVNNLSEKVNKMEHTVECYRVC